MDAETVAAADGEVDAESMWDWAAFEARLAALSELAAGGRVVPVAEEVVPALAALAKRDCELLGLCGDLLRIAKVQNARGELAEARLKRVEARLVTLAATVASEA